MLLRNRWLVWAQIAVVLAVVAPGSVHAQGAPKADPSPLAPGDLRRPIFDTQTPVYNKSNIQEKTAGTVVATVDGRAVTLGDVRDAIHALPSSVASLSFPELYPGVIAQLTSQEALVIRARRQALDEDPKVHRRMERAADQVLANELLTREISNSITEGALLERYNKEIAGKPGPYEVHLRVIMMPTEQEAMTIINDLRGGADFATLAKKSSQDPTASEGGDAGFATRDKLTREVGAVVFSMPPGQFTAFPVRNGDTWFVLKVEERRHAPTQPFNVVREELRQKMLHEGVAKVIKAALADVTVREYDVNGKESDESAAGQGGLIPR